MLTRLLYRAFRMNSAVRERLRRRFTSAGVFVMGVLAASAIVGFDTFQSVAYQAFAFLLALLGVSVASGARFRPRIEARRILPRLATAGEPLAYRVVVRNQTAKARRGWLLREDLADPRPSFEEFRDIRAPGEERDSRADQLVGYRRWEWLTAAKRQAVVDEEPLPTLPAGGEAEVRPRIVPLHRGHLRFDGMTIARQDPFGLAKASVTVPLPQSVLVLPKRYPVPSPGLPGARRFQQGGVALASSVGDSEEFASLRDYRPGDPLRRIHWKSWARLGKPIVKEYQDEFFVRHALVLDTFSSGADSEVFEEAVSVAASFAYAVQTQESLLDLMFVGPEAYCFTAGRGLSHVEKMLEVLACVGLCRDKPFRTLHQMVTGRSAALSGCIAVLLAWDDDRREFVRHLRALGIPTLALRVADGPAADSAATDEVHRLEVGKIAEGLARL